jgi:hypothetical protein
MVCGALALGCEPYESGLFTRAAAPGFEFLADVPKTEQSTTNSKRIFLFSDGETLLFEEKKLEHI